jgi:hypothetical protein
MGNELSRTLHETLKRVEDVRRCVADVVRGNLTSWEAGDALSESPRYRAHHQPSMSSATVEAA